MFCPKCGRKMSADARFCPSCGQTMNEPRSGVPRPPVPGSEKKSPEFRAHKSADDGMFRTKYEGKLPRETNYGKYISVLLAALAGVIIVGIGFYFFAPNIFQEKAPERLENPGTLTDEMIEHPEDFIDRNDDTQKARPEAVKSAQKEIRQLLETYLNAETHSNYTKIYTMMTGALHRWLENYYPGRGVRDTTSYSDARRTPEFEPLAKDYSIDKIAVTGGGRAVADVTISGELNSDSVKYAYKIIFVKTDGVWQVDGIPAGLAPGGPVVKSKRDDFDGDGEKETLLFYGDILHRSLRWEVVKKNGKQIYVFELPACGADGDSPEAIAASEAALASVANTQADIRGMGDAELAVFRQTFPQLADSVELRQALITARPGFIMNDGCGGEGYFVFYIKGRFMEVAAPPPLMEEPATEEPLAAESKKAKPARKTR